MTIAELLTEANVIRDETAAGANTHERIGDMFINIINTLAERTPSPPYNKASGQFWTKNINGVAALNQALTLNTLRAIPVLITEAAEYDEITIRVNAGNTNNISAGFYNSDANGYPSTLITDSEVEFTPSASNAFASQAFTNPVTLLPGLYFMAFNTNSAATINMCQPSFSVNIMGKMDLTNAVTEQIKNSYSVARAYGGMLADFPSSVAPGSVNEPYFILRYS